VFLHFLDAVSSATGWVLAQREQMTTRKHNDLRKHPPRLRPAGRLWHSEVPGPLWNGTRRVGAGQIRAYCRVVAREFRPRRIILFGSYATGAATADSDVDLVVLMPFRGSSTDKVVEIRGRVEAPFPLDLLVWRPAQARKRDSFTRGVLSEGKVMYEGRDA
jgi:predicted nucleotidyltransferase